MTEDSNLLNDLFPIVLDRSSNTVTFKTKKYKANFEGLAEDLQKVEWNGVRCVVYYTGRTIVLNDPFGFQNLLDWTPMAKIIESKVSLYLKKMGH
jgi:hypothetical protein